MAHSLFNLENAVIAGRKRVGGGARTRKVRADAGSSKMTATVLKFLQNSLSGFERPAMRELLARLELLCRKNGESVPSRVTVYRFLKRAATPSYQISELPGCVRDALYNLGSAGVMPGGQLAFYCLNYGGIEAISFASGLPWLCLYQACQMGGNRPQSKGLLDAIMKARGL